MNKLLRSAPLLLLSMTLGVANAQQASEPSATIVNESLVSPGSTVELTGKGFVPGSKINVKLDAGVNLTAGNPFIVNADGTFSGKVLLPAEVQVGRHVLNILGSERQSIEVRPRIYANPNLPISGRGMYYMAQNKLEEGLYQIAYSLDNDLLWVSSAVGREGSPSYLSAIDPQTLKIVKRYNVNRINPPEEGSKNNAAYGIDVDDSQNTIWTTDTRSDTVSVYDQATGKLIKNISYPGSHPREVLVDENDGKAYVSNYRTGDVSVIDTKTFAVNKIDLSDKKDSGSANLALDDTKNRLYVTDMSQTNPDENNVVVIDTDSQKVIATYPMNTVGATGIAIDTDLQHGYVASQYSSELTGFDLNTGKILFRTPTGAGALSAEVNPDNHYVYVSNRASGTVSVVDGRTGKILANIPTAINPNHEVLVNGVLYALNKGGSEDDSDQITRLIPK